METLKNMLKPSFLIIILYSDAPSIEIFSEPVSLVMEKARYENNLELMPLKKNQKPRDQLRNSG